MAYTDPVSWIVGQYIDIYAIDRSDGYFVQPFGSDYAYVHFYNTTETLKVNMDGFIEEILP